MPNGHAGGHQLLDLQEEPIQHVCGDPDGLFCGRSRHVEAGGGGGRSLGSARRGSGNGEFPARVRTLGRPCRSFMRRGLQDVLDLVSFPVHHVQHIRAELDLTALRARKCPFE